MTQNKTKDAISLDKPLLKFSSHPEDTWTLRDATKGVQIFGGIGSGKTSGSGRMLSKAFLENGFGGIVLCAKPDERENWEKLAKETGRYDDLIFFEKGGRWKFNPMDYETTREGGGETYNLVKLFMYIYQIGCNINGEGMAKESERFWDNALKRLLRRMIDLLKLSGREVSISNMHSLIVAYLSTEDMEAYKEIKRINDKDKFAEHFHKLAKRNFFVGCILDGYLNLEKEQGNGLASEAATEKMELQERDFKMVRNYFEHEFANLHDRTRTIIVESFMGIAEPFLSGLLYQYFAQNTNIYPEWTYQRGNIIILDFPVKKDLDAGIYAQSIFKLLWQQAMERRTYREGQIPVFLWADESQLFLNDYDQIFQTTARSSGACTVFLSQNISNYYSAIGGKDPRPKVDSILANLSTKVFHGNNDAVTNEWASRTIGKAFQLVRGYSAGERAESVSGSEQMHDMVGSADFTVLRGGGKENKFIVDGIFTVAGKKWSNGKNFLHVEFEQKN